MASIRRATGILAIVVALSLMLAIAQSGQSRSVRSAAPEIIRPHALKLLINGKRWPLESLTGADNYVGIPAGKLRVEARWTSDARGTGYYVKISMGEPLARELVRCTRGTTCVVPTRVPIKVNQEVTFTVKVLKTRGDRVVAGFRACLDGR